MRIIRNHVSLYGDTVPLTNKLLLAVTRLPKKKLKHFYSLHLEKAFRVKKTASLFNVYVFPNNSAICVYELHFNLLQHIKIREIILTIESKKRIQAL